MIIKNGPHFELEVLGQTNEENLALKFSGRIPNFGRDMREVVSARGEEKFPKTPLAESLHHMIEKRLKSLGVFTQELCILPAIGTMVDRYRETDCAVYLQTSNGEEAVVSIDLFFMEDRLLNMLREFWIKVSPSDIYSQGDFHCDLLRHSRIISDLMRGALKLDLPSDALGDIAKFESYKSLWLSDYIPQENILRIDPARGKVGYQNQLVVTPHQIVPYFQRKVLAGFIAELLEKQARPECYLCAS